MKIKTVEKKILKLHFHKINKIIQEINQYIKQVVYKNHQLKNLQ